ncbi:MAG: cytochrome c family protein, partial [Mangrovicoccus sp.]|nr:cytochrome c family protein [Mangrovicoccus sp.]
MRFAPFFAAALSLAGAALLAPLPAASQTSPDYLGSTACTDCHEAEAAAWAGSHHAWAWTEASPDRVLADFNNTEFNGTGMSVRFSQGEAGQYLVDVTEADGSQRRYPVHSVVGIEPLQQYLLETEPGRLQSFDVVWDTEQGGWFHLYPDPPRA